MSEPMYESDGPRRFLAGSKKTVIAGNYFYSHEQELRVIRYHNEKLVNNLAFDNVHLLREWMAAEVYKLEMGNKLIPNHNLDLKSILVLNTNLDSPSGNKVAFYEVTELVDVCTVRLRELRQEVFVRGNYSTAIPSVGLYASDVIIERKVIANSVKIAEKQIAMRLPFELYMVGGVLPIKVYKPSSFGIKA